MAMERRFHCCGFTFKRPPRGTAIVTLIQDKAMSSPPDKFNCLDYLSDQGLPDSPEFAGIHGWVDEVRNSRQELQFLKLFWNSKGKKHVNTETCCHIRPSPNGVIVGKDHRSREFTMEHLGNADFDTEETRARQHHTPPRKSISHPGGPGPGGARAGAGRSRAGWGGPPRYAGPGVPGTGDPEEEIHRWMINLWAREHVHDAVPLHAIPAEQLLTGGLVLRLNGGPGGAGQTAPEGEGGGRGAGQTAPSDECGGQTARPGA